VKNELCSQRTRLKNLFACAALRGLYVVPKVNLTRVERLRANGHERPLPLSGSPPVIGIQRRATTLATDALGRATLLCSSTDLTIRAGVALVIRIYAPALHLDLAAAQRST